MKIVFYIPDFWAGGAQKQAALLFNELSKIMPDNVLILYVRDGPNFKWLNCNHKNTKKLNFKKITDPRLFFEISREVEKFNATHLVSWLHGGDTAAGIASIILMRKIKWIIMERDSSYPLGWKFRLREIIGKLSDKILCNSDPGMLYWSNIGYPVDKIGRVYNIVLPSGISVVDDSDVFLSDKRFDIVSWGRMEDQKNPLRVASVFARIIDRCCLNSKLNSNISCLIGGSGSLYGKISDFVKSKNCSNLVCCGYISDTGKILKYKPIFFSLSKHEGTPNAVLEALMAGCLVVLSNIEEHKAIVGENYPFMVDLDADDEAATDILEKAILANGDNNIKYLRNAYNYLSKNTPESVAHSFLSQLP